MATYSLFTGQNPAFTNRDNTTYTLGMFFKSSIAGWITHIRIYVHEADNQIVLLYSATGTELSRVTIPGTVTADTWYDAQLPAPVVITTDTVYMAAFFTQHGTYGATSHLFDQPVIVPPLRGLAAWEAPGVGNGMYNTWTSPAFPDSTFASTWYGIDVVITDVQPGNSSPFADAGQDQTVQAAYTAAGVETTTVTLDGSASYDADGSVASYAWTQLSGTAVTLSSASVAKPTFAAPKFGGVLTFGLTVTDNEGAASAQDTVQVTVTPVAYGWVRVSGAWIKRALFVHSSGSWT